MNKMNKMTDELTIGTALVLMGSHDVSIKIENNMDLDTLKWRIKMHVNNILNKNERRTLIWSDCDCDQPSIKLYFSVNKWNSWEQTDRLDELMNWVGERRKIAMVELEDDLYMVSGDN